MNLIPIVLKIQAENMQHAQDYEILLFRVVTL